MKSFILFIALCALVMLDLRAQTPPFTVKLRIGQVDTTCFPSCDKPSEWHVPVWIDIFDANYSYVNPSSEYYYELWQDYCDGQGFVLLHHQGYGAYQWEPDGLVVKSFPGCCSSCYYQTINAYARVRINDVYYTSSVVRFPDEGNTGQIINFKQQVTVDQKRGSQASYGSFGRKLGATFYNYPAPFTFPITQNTTEVFRAPQGLASAPYEKYHHWVNQGDILNHRSFLITQPPPTTVSQLATVYNPTIQTCTVDGITPASVFFKDPWLVDDYSDPLGPRNRGNNALFYSKSTPFYPLNDASTKGVFLGQEIAPGLPYYTVRAYDIVEGTRLLWSFGYWTATNASLADPNNIESAVVFNSANATVTANYTTVIKPLPPANVTAGGPFGSYVTVTWDEHPV